MADSRQDGSGQWTVAWEDNFDGRAGAPPNPDNWLYDLGNGYPGGPSGWGNRELQTYTADPVNVALDGAGRLRITATRDPSGQWRSGRLETRRSDFQPPPGGSLKIEARMALPSGGQGYWPALWALGQPFRTGERSWPAGGEIDIMENVNNSRTIHGTLHCEQPTGGACNEPVGRSRRYELFAPAGAAGTHTYTLIWDTRPERLRWQVDGRTFGTATPSTVGEQAWRDTLNHGYFLLLDLAIGGNWPGPPDSITKPGESMLVDYVRVSTSR